MVLRVLRGKSYFLMNGRDFSVAVRVVSRPRRCPMGRMAVFELSSAFTTENHGGRWRGLLDPTMRNDAGHSGGGLAGCPYSDHRSPGNVGRVLARWAQHAVIDKPEREPRLINLQDHPNTITVRYLVRHCVEESGRSRSARPILVRYITKHQKLNESARKTTSLTNRHSGPLAGSDVQVAGKFDFVDRCQLA